MKKLALLVLVSSALYAPVKVETVLVKDGTEAAHEQIWYVGDHIKRECGGVVLDGTIREIYGNDVTVHFKVLKGDEVVSEHDVKAAWGQVGVLEYADATLRITLTDLYDQHPKKQPEAA